MKFVLVGNVLFCDTEPLGKSVETFALNTTSRPPKWVVERQVLSMGAHVLPLQLVGSLDHFFRVRQFLSWSSFAYEARPGCWVQLVLFPLDQSLLEPIMPFFFLAISYTTNRHKFRGLSAGEDFGLWGSSLPVRKDVCWKHHSCFTAFFFISPGKVFSGLTSSEQTWQFCHYQQEV